MGGRSGRHTARGLGEDTRFGQRAGQRPVSAQLGG